MNQLIEALMAIAGIAFLIAAFATAGVNKLRQRLRSAEEDLAWYKQKYPTRNGWILGLGDYNLLSTDSGKTWWNAGKNGMITGPADPELLKKIQGWDKLTALGRQIDYDNPEDVAIMEEAGFTIERK